MTFRQMELFVCVCENKSISKTSEKLFISQQGISKMIRELEEELECKLLNRTKSGVTMTENGSYFFAECKSILDKKKALVNNISDKHKIPHETIYLGMAYGIIAALPHRLIPEFEEKNERVTLSYNDHTDLQLESLLQSGEYDFCITAGILDSDTFSSELLFSEKIYLCIPKTHSLYCQTSIQMKDLDEQSFAMFTTQFYIRHNFEKVCHQAGITPKIEISSNDFNSLKEIAIHNNLLFIVPEHTITDTQTDFRYCVFPDPHFLWSIYFIKRNAKTLTRNMLHFYTYLKAITKDMDNEESR